MPCRRQGLARPVPGPFSPGRPGRRGGGRWRGLREGMASGGIRRLPRSAIEDVWEPPPARCSRSSGRRAGPGERSRMCRSASRAAHARHREIEQHGGHDRVAVIERLERGHAVLGREHAGIRAARASGPRPRGRPPRPPPPGRSRGRASRRPRSGAASTSATPARRETGCGRWCPRRARCGSGCARDGSSTMPMTAASPSPRPVNLVQKKGSKMRCSVLAVHAAAGVAHLEKHEVLRTRLRRGIVGPAGAEGDGCRAPRSRRRRRW